MLELKNVTKRFDDLVAVNDLSFTAESGKILGIVGRNGARKKYNLQDDFKYFKSRFW